jgi:uncharacterized protein (DUF1810 family)
MDLDRFVVAQAPLFARALGELRAGAKRGHWMWFVFPQVAGLGRSDTARFYALSGRTEAQAYLAHPLLGPRLLEATAAISDAAGSAEAILGPVDAMKLRSSMTLFESVAADPQPFAHALERFFDGMRDPQTLARLR